MTTIATTTKDRVLEDLATMVREVIAEDWALDVPITMETSFADDLELESIEFVALAEKLKLAYGKRVDFASWLATMELKEIISLRAGTLVEYIDRCLSRPTTA
jgi:acyl carrier protein